MLQYSKNKTLVKLLCTLYLLFGALCFSYGQGCNGNLGDNIFIDGDFGSGVANILLDDPQIAPGYIYQTNPPPNDGFYTIANSTAPWGSFATLWDDIGDNSNDPNGYMMVVNASFDPGLFYQQEVDGLCDNTLYYFSVDVYNLISNLNPNISFQIDGNTLFGTGAVPYNGIWNSYGFTFQTEPGQTNINLALSNNAPGGNGNDLAIDNISFRPCGPEALILPDEIEDVCEDGNPLDLVATINGEQYDTPEIQWQQSFDEGMSWTDIGGANDLIYTHTDLSAGFYYYRYLLANDPSHLLNSKCRVISNIKIVRVVPKFYTITDTLCEGLSFALGDDLYSETGIYEDNFITAIGCDSIVTLDLTIVQDPGIEILLESTDPSCDDVEDGSIDLINIMNGVDPYSIFINDILYDNGANLEFLPAGEYNYLITDRYGCTNESNVDLISPDPFIVELGNDIEVDLGTSIVVDPIYSESAISIQWNDGELINCNPDCESLAFLPFQTDELILSAISEAGCIARDTINVFVEKVRKVYFPNIFSPNGDGVNDFFSVFGDANNVQVIEKLLIYDRWGNVVFTTKNLLPNQPELGWNGRNRSNELQSGVYTYLASILFVDGEVVSFVGDVTMVK